MTGRSFGRAVARAGIRAGLVVVLLGVLAGFVVFTTPPPDRLLAAAASVPVPAATTAPVPVVEPVVVPDRYASLIRAAVDRCPALTADLLAAQLWVESSWDAKAVSPAGAKGLGQFMPDTWKAYGVDGNADGAKKAMDPADAIPASAVFDCALLDTTRGVTGDPLVNMLAAYNAGPTAVRKYDGIPPFPETQAYVDKVADAATRVDWPKTVTQSP